jgi:uncharacterized protein (TIGR03437 family)
MTRPVVLSRRSALGCAVLALACSGGAAQAASQLTATPSKVALTCSTANGPGPEAIVVIKPISTLTSNSITVTLGAVGGGLVVKPPSSTVLNSANQAKGLSYSISLAAGCAGASTGSTSIRFQIGSTVDVSVTATTTVTASASALVAQPVTVSCVRNPGPPVSYAPASAQTLAVTSAAAGGTPFTVDSASLPAWLKVTPLGGGIAGETAVPLSVVVAASCGSLAAGTTNSGNIRLRNQPAPDVLVPVTLRVVGPSTVTANPTSVSLTYVKGSDTVASADVALSAGASASATYTVDAASLPAWLSSNALSGTLPAALRLSTTAMADSMSQGSYTATLRLQVSGSTELSLPVNLLLNNPAAKLTVTDGLARDISWTVGQPAPTASVTLASSGSAIPYTIVTGGALAPSVPAALLKGMAYSYGTTIPVAFDPSVFAAAQAGTVLNGTVTVTWGASNTKTVVTFKVTVQSPGAVLSGVSPRSLPTAAAGQTFMVALSGTGFTPATNAGSQTTVGIVSGGKVVANPNLSADVLNPSNIILTITVPAKPDSALPFDASGTGGVVTIGVCNGSVAAPCTTASGTVQLTIGSLPVVQAVTSASSYVQVAPPAMPAIAPYDMLSLFGINFCNAGGTGCGDDILYGSLDATTLRFPVSLSPDDAEASPRRQLTVTFQTHASPPVAIGSAPLLFATDNQINLLVPAAVSAFIGKSIDVVVNFGAPEGTSRTSAPFTVAVVAANPGVFTVGGDGQGEGAILALDWSMVTRGNEAEMRPSAADSDIVQIYLTGLGLPDSTADNSAAGIGQWPGDCVAVSTYQATFNLLTSTSSTTLDGALIPGGFLNTGRLAPCFRAAANIPTVTVGGQPATIIYAGWAPDAVAGQYQINVRLPGSGQGPFSTGSGSQITGPLTEPVQLPVVVTARGRSSQAGVSIWVAPRLKVVAPASSGLRGTAGSAWPSTGNAVVASGGTGPYQYSVSAGALPAGLSLSATSGAISGTAAAASAGTYDVVVTVTDSASKPISGSVSFSLVVASVRQ